MRNADKINEMIIAGLQRDGLKWFKPWTDANGNIGMPINNVTGKAYAGGNLFILNSQMNRNDFSYNEWLTFKQCAAKGGSIIKGSKSTPVYFWQPSWYDSTEQPRKYYRTEKECLQSCLNRGSHPDNIVVTFMLKMYNVFNIAQCEGIEPRNPIVETEPKAVIPSEACENAQKAIDAWTGCPKIETANKAVYKPSTDVVGMPRIDTFLDCDSYYKTLFHELGHSTGHKSRLNRPEITLGGWDKDRYSKEELTAEICSVYLTEFFKLDPKDGFDNSQAYINGWVSRIKNAKGNEANFVISAMTKAAKATEMILGN